MSTWTKCKTKLQNAGNKLAEIMYLSNLRKSQQLRQLRVQLRNQNLYCFFALPFKENPDFEVYFDKGRVDGSTNVHMDLGK